MELNNDLITQFAKIAKINTKDKGTTTVRGTVHISEGRNYIRLDGAAENSLTPVETTVEINEGDRVIAAVKDHSIIITGNKTNPSVGTVTAGNLSTTIEQTAEKITLKATADYNDLNGKITDEATARANGDTGLGNRITKAESLITQTATEIRSEVKADYDTLDGKITDESKARADGDDGLSKRLVSAESTFTQRADQIQSTVKANYETLDDKITDESTARANGDNGLSTRITSAESTFTQRADQIQSTVKANYETLDDKITDESTARANGDSDLSSRITSAESTFTQRADKIEGTVTANYNTLDNKIGTVQSSLTQTATSITSRVSTLENNDVEFSEFKQTVEGFSFMGEGGTVKINGGDINLTGAITWSDLSTQAKTDLKENMIDPLEERVDEVDGEVGVALTRAQTASNRANEAYVLAEEAKNAAGSLGLPSYIKSTYIDATKIESPTIIGGTFYAVGSDPDSDSTFTTMDENGFYLYSNMSKADINNEIYPKISLYCDSSSLYGNPMIILGSGESDSFQFHNRFVIEKSGFSVNMEYHFDYSYTSCGFTFNSDGTIYIDGELRGYTGVFPIGYIYLSMDSTSPSSLFGGEWERLPGALLFSTTSDTAIGDSGDRVTVAASSGMNTIKIAAWRRTG